MPKHTPSPLFHIDDITPLADGIRAAPLTDLILGRTTGCLVHLSALALQTARSIRTATTAQPNQAPTTVFI